MLFERFGEPRDPLLAAATALAVDAAGAQQWRATAREAASIGPVHRPLAVLRQAAHAGWAVETSWSGTMLVVDDLRDFLWQMELVVLEEAPLYEIPQGSIDDPGGSAVIHGPWPASTCAAVLKLWYRAGWIGLYFRDPPPGWNVAAAEWRKRLTDGEDLAAQDAHGLLEQPERWVLEHADGHVQPYRTVEGEITPREQWFEHVFETARSLPLKP